jgi:hypothetical protein
MANYLLFWINRGGLYNYPLKYFPASHTRRHVAEKQAAHFIILREKVTGEMIAFMLCFDMGERLINAFTGMDYSRPKEWMLYFRLWDAAVDLALSRGFTAIVSGRSSHEAKIEIGHKRMFEKSWQIKTHGTRTRVRPSCLEAGMGKHSR